MTDHREQKAEPEEGILDRSQEPKTQNDIATEWCLQFAESLWPQVGAVATRNGLINAFRTVAIASGVSEAEFKEICETEAAGYARFAEQFKVLNSGGSRA